MEPSPPVPPVRKRRGPPLTDFRGKLIPEGELRVSEDRQKRKKSANVVPKAHRGTFHPEYVGVIHNYPKTLEAYDKNRQNGRNSFAAYHARMGHWPNRHGVPDGWGGKTVLLKRVREAAKIEAKEILQKMTDENILPEGMDPRAHEALEFAIQVVRAKHPETAQPAYAVRDHLAAARVVLEYTHTKPASTSNVNIGTAESFLEGLVGRRKE